MLQKLELLVNAYAQVNSLTVDGEAYETTPDNGDAATESEQGQEEEELAESDLENEDVGENDAAVDDAGVVSAADFDPTAAGHPPPFQEVPEDSAQLP